MGSRPTRGRNRTCQSLDSLLQFLSIESPPRTPCPAIRTPGQPSSVDPAHARCGINTGGYLMWVPSQDPKTFVPSASPSPVGEAYIHYVELSSILGFWPRSQARRLKVTRW
ncbi:hypothetical protein FA13DRAFT_1740056 [Coprinellus micaceus]|uniref:Uncharacterized protein n=1 Tax=Coprinellus micaceus TaxID=71717 RepID=A0A4Y7SNX0_COPMI|nr:hypothetical protein FA13DRAFT_1740056 [Coprinellus micaceus]